MKCYRNAAAICMSILALTGLILANSNGESFEGITGAPGESTCADCHNNLNTGSGSATITAPAGYDSGDTLNITVAVEHSGQSHWGFEVTALDAGDQPAGEIVVTDVDRTQKITAVSGREYIKHTLLGSDPGIASSTEWGFKWVAPATDIGQITFYMAGVAGNEASGPNGDYTYTTTHALLSTWAHDVTGHQLPSEFFLAQNYPNPFNPSTTIQFDLPERSNVRVTVFNILGQKVKVLYEGELVAGTYTLKWNGTDLHGSAVAGGAYFCRLETEDQCAMRKMVLLK